jgi:hypothetical protein
MQRRIEETQVTVFLIQPGTPPEVEFNIFKRINTGGLPLSPQEIRHALNQGSATEMLRDLAELPEFAMVASSLSNERMADRECVLRFLAFAMTPYQTYKSADLDDFLNKQMKRLNAMSGNERADLRERFRRALVAANQIFGRHSFRKRYALDDQRRKPINKPLFEAWSVSLDSLTDDQLATLVARRDRVNQYLVKLLNDRDFEAAITQATGDIRKVHLRFSETEVLINAVLTEAE